MQILPRPSTANWQMVFFSICNNALILCWWHKLNALSRLAFWFCPSTANHTFQRHTFRCRSQGIEGPPPHPHFERQWLSGKNQSLRQIYVIRNCHFFHEDVWGQILDFSWILVKIAINFPKNSHLGTHPKDNAVLRHRIPTRFVSIILLTNKISL